MYEETLAKAKGISDFYLSCIEKSTSEFIVYVGFYLIKNPKNKDLNFRKFLTENKFTPDTPYAYFEIDDDESSISMAQSLCKEKNGQVPFAFYCLYGNVEFDLSAQGLYEGKISHQPKVKELSPSESLTTLLYLSKMMAILLKHNVITPAHVYYALQYVILSEKGHFFFSNFFEESIDKLKHSTEWEKAISIAKNHPKMPYDEAMKELIKDLESKFSDEPICALPIAQ